MTPAEHMTSIFSYDRTAPKAAVQQFRKALNFRGRSSREDFVSYFVVAAFVTMALAVFGLIVGLDEGQTSQLNSLVLVWKLLFIPIPSLLARRLHDQGRSSIWGIPLLTIWAIPLFRPQSPFAEADLMSVIGGFASVALLVVLLWPGTVGPNRFGPDSLTTATGSNLKALES